MRTVSTIFSGAVSTLFRVGWQCGRRFVRLVREAAPHAADELHVLGVSSAACPIIVRSVRGFRVLSALCGVSIPHRADEPPENDGSSAPCPRTQRMNRENTAQSGRAAHAQVMRNKSATPRPHIVFPSEQSESRDTPRVRQQSCIGSLELVLSAPLGKTLGVVRHGVSAEC